MNGDINELKKGPEGIYAQTARLRHWPLRVFVDAIIALFVVELAIIQVLFHDLSPNSLWRGLLASFLLVTVFGPVAYFLVCRLLVVQSTERTRAEQDRDRFFSLSSDIFCVAAFDGHLRAVNSAFVTTVGFSERQLLSVPFIEFVHPQDRAATRGELQKLQTGKPTIDFEVRWKCKDGSHKWIAWSAAPAIGGLVYAVGRDVTEKKVAAEAVQKRSEELETQVRERTAELTAANERLRAEIALHNSAQESLSAALVESRRSEAALLSVLETLRDSEERHRAVVETATSAIITIDTDLRIVSWNKAAEIIFGYLAIEVVGQPATLILPEQFRKWYVDEIGAIFKNRPCPPGGVEFFGLRRDGSEFPGDIVLSTWKTKDGRFLTGMVRDLTESKQHETLFMTLFRRSSVGTYVVQEGKVLFVNPELARLTGYAEDELIGADPLGLVVSEQRGMVRAAAIEMLKADQQTPYEFRAQGKDGQVKWYLGTVSSIQYKGRMAVLGECLDITKLKQAECEVKRSFETLQQTLLGTIQAMALTVEIRDAYTAGHQRRVAELACAIAREMGLSEETVQVIQLAAIIHDIGKIYVPAEFLNKPGRLSDLEFNTIKTHPDVGYQILETIEFPWPIADIVHQHHEFWDGSGYPLGLKGDEALLEARILVVSDVVEAMASHRPYRPALGIDRALEEISRNRGILFDPIVVDACLRVLTERGFVFGQQTNGVTSEMPLVY